MPYADPLKRKEYMREYHLKRKLETKPEPKPEPVNDSWSTKVYEGPPIAETKDMEDIVSGMTQRELNKINEDIQDALEPKEIPERYSRLKTEALSRIKLGESGLIFDLDSSKTVDIDLMTFKHRPVIIIDDDELITWGP